MRKMKNEIIHVKDDRYAEYEDLLLRRDELKREAGSIRIEYVKEFGNLITELFHLEVDCIRLKKEISYAVASANRGETIDIDAMKEQISGEMSDYQKQLDDMIQENEACRDAKESTEENLMKVKRLYRTIAKQLHPDINPKTEDDSKLRELWTRVVAAYHALDLKEMEELSVLVTAALKAAGMEGTEIDIPDITEKIDQLKAEIEKIRTTDPYMYGELLNDRLSVADKKQELRDDIEEYKTYKNELTEKLDQILLKNGVQFKWEMK